MSAAPPPQCVSVRKAVTREALYEGSLGPSELGSVGDVLPGNERIAFSARFGRDEEGRQVVDLSVTGTVELVCQRCLNPFALPVQSESRLGLVMTDEQAQGLPKEYEPWIALDEADLWAMAREELALALPVVAFHPPGECESPAAKDVGADETQTEEKQNPFDVLSSLLVGEDKQEK